jgi:hypothetical protein
MLVYEKPHVAGPSETLETYLKENTRHNLALNFAIDAIQEGKIYQAHKNHHKHKGEQVPHCGVRVLDTHSNSRKFFCFEL